MSLLLLACAAPCVEPGGAAVAVEAFGAEGDAVVRAFPWEGGERVVWRDGSSIRARDLDAEGNWLGGTWFTEIDGFELLDVLPTSDGLVVFGGDTAYPGTLRVDRFAGDGTFLGTGSARVAYLDLGAARAVATDAGFAVAAYAPDENFFATLDEEGDPLHVHTLGRAPATDARLAWNGARFAIAWGGEGDSPALELRQRDGQAVGTETALAAGWAGVASDPVWTGTDWAALVGLGTKVTGEPGGAVIVNRIAPNGERESWDTLVGDLPAAVDDLALVVDGAGGAVVWMSGGEVSVVAVDSELRAQGCILSGTTAGGLYDVWLEDGTVTAWTGSGTEVWRWTAALAP